MAVSRFFCFPIQMNFAENEKWPTSPSVAGPARQWGRWVYEGGRGKPQLATQSAGGGLAWSPNRCLPTPVPYLADVAPRDLLYRLVGSRLSLAIGHSARRPPRKPVAQASRRTGDARRQWRAHCLTTAAGWVRWADWPLGERLTQSNRGQPRAADAAMVDAAR